MVAICVLVFSLTLLGCSTSGSDGAQGPSGVEIYSIIANPSVVRPGASTILSVSAGDGLNSALTYSWQAAAGTLSSTSTSSITWTAPASVGSYLVNVEVTNAAGLKAKGYASILVSVSPAGPIVTSVNPAEVKAGDQIRITGAGFGSIQGTSSVSIGGTPALSIISWSDTVITTTVPAGAANGSVLVTAAGVNSSPGYIVVLWTKEDPENVAISVAAGDQRYPQPISDGSGGAIITWMDFRDGNFDIYAQRVNGAGVVQWTADGVAISTAAGEQSFPQLISDGSGGAIITWMDFRNGNFDIYAQRVNGAGVAQWTADGVAISTASDDQNNPQLIPDGSGGAIITWWDHHNGSWDIYAQRVNSAGIVQWTADGVAISTAAGDQENPQIISDNSGGAIITWQDYRNISNADVYAQRVNSAGAVQWTTDGVAISTAVHDQYVAQLISDNSGGAIIAWHDYRNGSDADIYVQRVNSAGLVQWTTDGVAISALAGEQIIPQLISDGSGGAIITWMDHRSGTWDIYAQQVNSAGTVQWTADGIAISTAAGDQIYPQLISDNSGGAIITWEDGRSGTDDIYAQHVNRFGAVQWTLDGVGISTAVNYQSNPQLVSDGSGGAIITWEDPRSGTNYDIYAQDISASGRQ